MVVADETKVWRGLSRCDDCLILILTGIEFNRYTEIADYQFRYGPGDSPRVPHGDPQATIRKCHREESQSIGRIRELHDIHTGRTDTIAERVRKRG